MVLFLKQEEFWGIILILKVKRNQLFLIVNLGSRKQFVNVTYFGMDIAGARVPRPGIVKFCNSVRDCKWGCHREVVA